LTASLLFGAWFAACGRPLTAAKDAGMDGAPSGTGATVGTRGGAGGAGGDGGAGGAGGDGRGGASAGTGGAGVGGGGGTARSCRCSDGRCCGLDQLCEIPTGACLTDGLPDGVCLPRPDACPDIDRPVCGCDEITYSNDCYRQLARTPKRAEGVCVGTCPPLIPVGACTNPGKVCMYGLNSRPDCTVKATCDQTGQWSVAPAVCP
jgi:hypothetical protein